MTAAESARELLEGIERGTTIPAQQQAAGTVAIGWALLAVAEALGGLNEEQIEVLLEPLGDLGLEAEPPEPG